MTTTPPAPTVTVYTDADPCPRAEVVVTPMPGDADQITVYRSWRGQRVVVRDAKDAEVAGAFLVVDYEVPLGTPVTYTCVTKDVSAVPSEESAGTVVTVSVTTVWIQDALDPNTALPATTTRVGNTGIQVIADSFVPATYTVDSVLAPIVGSPLPVGLGGTRRAAGRVPLTFIAWSSADADLLRTLLAQAYPLCVRMPATIPQLDGLAYFALPDVTETPYPGWAATQFASVGDSVRGPGSGIAIQPRTFADLLDEAATFADLMTLYPTFLDVRRGL